MRELFSCLVHLPIKLDFFRVILSLKHWFGRCYCRLLHCKGTMNASLEGGGGAPKPGSSPAAQPGRERAACSRRHVGRVWSSTNYSLNNVIWRQEGSEYCKRNYFKCEATIQWSATFGPRSLPFKISPSSRNWQCGLSDSVMNWQCSITFITYQLSGSF